VNAAYLVIIDGTRGVVIVNPDAEQLAEHRAAGKARDRERQLQESPPSRPSP
jgi:phosphoenolpyruvate-protein kinase (PTS system EI component)